LAKSKRKNASESVTQRPVVRSDDDAGSRSDAGESQGQSRPLSENFLRVWLPTLVTALFIITFNVQAFEIPSPSMEKTLLIGDHVLVDRVRFSPPSGYLHGLEPYRPLRRGDIVVFMAVKGEHSPGLHLVKRLIGLPGDHIHLWHKTVYLNGVPQKEPYVIQNDEYSPPRDDFPNGGPLFGGTDDWEQSESQYVHDGDIVVPPHSYWMMGDNRDLSEDSRYWGFVPEANIIGRPVLIYWSYRSTEQDYPQNPSFGERIGSLFSVLIHFPVRTRWSRTFRLVR
jgi:signal peptidase I